jgi:acyl dehydratase
MSTIAFDPQALQPGWELSGERRWARNTSAASENKIHDDEVARRYGFGGGLVPGATSYAYLASWLTRALGPLWAAHGSATIALVKPVYEGEEVHLGGRVTAMAGDTERGSLALECWVDGPDGVRRATGTAALTWGEPRATEPWPAFARRDLPSRRREERPPLSAATAPVGEPLPPVVFAMDDAARTRYLDDIEEGQPLFRTASPFGGPLVHPGWYLHAANRVLSENFALGPWIHTRSEVRHLAPALARGVYRGYGQITAAFEKRGHEYVTADVLIVDGDERPVARVLHTAIVVVAARA